MALLESSLDTVEVVCVEVVAVVVCGDDVGGDGALLVIEVEGAGAAAAIELFVFFRHGCLRGREAGVRSSTTLAEKVEGGGVERQAVHR